MRASQRDSNQISNTGLTGQSGKICQRSTNPFEEIPLKYERSDQRTAQLHAAVVGDHPHEHGVRWSPHGSQRPELSGLAGAQWTESDLSFPSDKRRVPQISRDICETDSAVRRDSTTVAIDQMVQSGRTVRNGPESMALAQVGSRESFGVREHGADSSRMSLRAELHRAQQSQNTSRCIPDNSTVISMEKNGEASIIMTS